MLKCTYIVLIHNNESNIENLVSSLKSISGDFRREFIFVDDGSTDESLEMLKYAVNDLPRTTIITQNQQGPAISVNKALNLASGDYVHFVEGDEILHRDSTNLLIEACTKLGCEVAVGLVSAKDLAKNSIEATATLVDSPIKEILQQSLEPIDQIGRSGSLVHMSLLNKIGKADESIYTQNMSLSLRCAKHSKFAFVNHQISKLEKTRDTEESKFLAYNNIKAVYNFASENKDLVKNMETQMLKFLKDHAHKKSDKVGFSMKYFISKYTSAYSLSRILSLYKTELDKLF